jgi:hypothetical protein
MYNSHAQPEDFAVGTLEELTIRGRELFSRFEQLVRVSE